MSIKKHYFPPTNLNKEPYLTVWWMEDFKPTTCYIQVSEDQNNPVWLRFGEALELICRSKIDTDPQFIEDIINSIRYNDYSVGIAHIKSTITK